MGPPASAAYNDELLLLPLHVPGHEPLPTSNLGGRDLLSSVVSQLSGERSSEREVPWNSQPEHGAFWTLTSWLAIAKGAGRITKHRNSGKYRNVFTSVVHFSPR